MDIKKLAEKHDGYIVEQRRYFHQYPELSYEETETTGAIKKQLEAMGIPVTTYPDYTGLTGIIKGGKPGKRVLLRADIDALPVTEHTGLSFCSRNEGKMHACGHDCHIAMLLGAAKILAEIKNDLAGEVKLIFQAGEETAYGAQYYIDHGVLDGVDAAFGMHIWDAVPSGKFNLEAGGRMASFDRLKIKVKGLGAHGSAPHQGRDAIAAAAAIIMNLQTIVSRENNPLNSLVVTIGEIHGGRRFNIIADEVSMDGTIRTYSEDFRETLEERLNRIAQDTARALGCEAEVDYKRLLKPVINDNEELNHIVRNAAVKLYGEDSLAPMDKTMGSEDFAMFMHKVPGFYGFIGSHSRELDKIYPNHSDHYDVDESILHRGSALYAQFAFDFLGK